MSSSKRTRNNHRQNCLSRLREVVSNLFPSLLGYVGTFSMEQHRKFMEVLRCGNCDVMSCREGFIAVFGQAVKSYVQAHPSWCGDAGTSYQLNLLTHPTFDASPWFFRSADMYSNVCQFLYVFVGLGFVILEKMLANACKSIQTADDDG